MDKKDDNNTSHTSQAKANTDAFVGCLMGFVYNLAVILIIVFVLGGAVNKILNLRLRMNLGLWTIITIVLIVINMWWLKFRYKKKRRTLAQGWYIGLVLILLAFGFIILLANVPSIL
jgi:uncharacterized metal-binding protein